jgi:hypothetical protein
LKLALLSIFQCRMTHVKTVKPLIFLTSWAHIMPKLWRLVAALHTNSTGIGSNDNQIKFYCISIFITLVTKGRYVFKLFFYIIFLCKNDYGWIMIWPCRMSQYIRFQCHHTESCNGYCIHSTQDIKIREPFNRVQLRPL